MGYRTMRGVEFDVEKFVRKNELMPAIGNMKVNARGDELGPGGKIVRKREEVVAEYYEDNPNAQAKFAAPAQSEPVVQKPKKNLTEE